STYLLDNGIQRGQIDKTLFIKKVKGNILLVQVYVDDIIFGSTKKVLCTEFEKLMHKKFQMSSMGELTFFLGLQVTQKDDGIFISQDKYVTEILKKFGFSDVKTSSTPMEIHKPLLKDADGEDVHEHLYKSIIGSLMYLTSSRSDIMFFVCARARYQVNPKASHLHVVKRIYRYLKGQPKLGLWYLKDLPFDLVTYTDSVYAGASLDRKSTIGGCQFLGCRLISWQCKKQTMVANSTIEAEYIAASNCCRQISISDYKYWNAQISKVLINFFCLEWNGTSAKDEIQVSVVRLTYYAPTTTFNELTLAQTLIKIKTAKPKAVTTTATTTTTVVTRLKARGVVVQEPQLSCQKQREEDENITEWHNVQAMIDADYELAARLQAQEQEALTVEEKSKLFVELMDKRKKHFERLRAEEQRRKPPTKSQKRN
ncbi:uncharacterized mitochondrial protein-like protein, partial [Tanacetum coccineum]